MLKIASIALACAAALLIALQIAYRNTVPATPEERIKALYADLSLAYGSPRDELLDPVNQRYWAEKIARHAAPSDRLASQEQTKEMMTELGRSNGSLMFEGVEVTVVSQTADTAVVRTSAGTMIMVTDGERFEADLSATPQNQTLTLRRIDGVWYFVP